MDFELDPFADVLPEPSNNNARAGAKFQPKAKTRLKKEIKPTVTSNHVDATKREEKHDIEYLTTLTNSSSILFESQESVQRTEVSHPGLLVPNDDRISALVDNSPQHVNTTDDTDNTTYDTDSTLHVKLTISDIHGDLQSGFPGLGETADIFSELDSLDGILSQSTTANAVSAVRKFQPKVKINGQPRNKLPPSRPVANDAAEASIHHASNVSDFVDRPGLPALSSNDFSALQSSSSMPADASPEFLTSQDPTNSREAETFDFGGDFLMDAGRLNREVAEAFPGLKSFGVVDQANVTAGDAQLIASGTECLEEDLTSAFSTDDFHELSTMKSSNSAPNDPPSEFQVTEQLTNVAIASSLNAAAALEEILDPQAAPALLKKEVPKNRKRKISLVTKEVDREAHSRNADKLSQGNQDKKHVLESGEGNEVVKSTMQLRKRTTTTFADTLEDGSQENGDPQDEVTSDSLMDQDVNNSDSDEYKGEETPCSKRVPRKSKKDKTVRRGNTAEEASQSNKEPPKKKFSHSTRRNRRQVNKVLLESEEIIDPKKLMIKDLILLAEVKEQMLNKDTTASKKSLPNQRSFAWDGASYGDDPFASEQDLNPDDGAEEVHKIDQSSIKLNYHSYMEKTPKERWSKQDTELFYEGVRQFGTDFAMIQQLFPGRTRHQVKLKYKKEERQHPLKLYDALTNRSKDHSHFELVIEQLQHAAAVKADENSHGDVESAGVAGEEEITTETNEDVNKSKQDDEYGTDDLQAEAPKFSSPVKSDQSEDHPDRWSQYKSDYDDYVS